MLRGGGEAGEGEPYTARAGLETCRDLTGGMGGSYALNVFGRNCATSTFGEGGGTSDTTGAGGGGTGIDVFPYAGVCESVPYEYVCCCDAGAAVYEGL